MERIERNCRFLKVVVENQDGSYSILNVVGADEYAQHVDDNAFTNASAIESLKTLLKRPF
jgi:trehalose/maltose hydrolase-like predicted phosphorylase